MLVDLNLIIWTQINFELMFTLSFLLPSLCKKCFPISTINFVHYPFTYFTNQNLQHIMPNPANLTNPLKKGWLVKEQPQVSSCLDCSRVDMFPSGLTAVTVTQTRLERLRHKTIPPPRNAHFTTFQMAT